MNKKIALGSILAVVLLTLVSFSSVVGYSSVKSDIDISVEENATPIALVFQLIAKLRNHKDIQQLVADDEVDIQDEIASIIESDEELNSIVEQLSVEDCGCEEDSSEFYWFFPIICNLLLPFYTFTVIILGSIFGPPFGIIMMAIGRSLNCFWAFPKV